MTKAAVDPQLARVMPMAEQHRLVGREPDPVPVRGVKIGEHEGGAAGGGKDNEQQPDAKKRRRARPKGRADGGFGIELGGLLRHPVTCRTGAARNAAATPAT